MEIKWKYIYIYKNNEIHITFAQYQQLLHPFFLSLSFLLFFLYSVSSFYLVLHLTNFRTLNKMLVINQSCHSKNTQIHHRISAPLLFIFLLSPHSSFLNLSASTILNTQRRHTHTYCKVHTDRRCALLLPVCCSLLVICKGAFTMKAIKSLEVTKSLYY